MPKCFLKVSSFIKIFILLNLCMIENSICDSSKNIFKFSSNCDIQNWNIVNDDVMGGISRSSFTLSDKGYGVFKGNVSTENYGGFASVQYSFNPIVLENHKYIKLRIKGDGRNYQFRIKHKASDYFSYVKSFPTSGEWETIDLELTDFYPSFRGRKLNSPNFNHDSFEQIAFLISNKRDEFFCLEIDAIYLE